MINYEKKIEAFLGKAEKIRTEMRRSKEGSLIVDQINSSLVFVSINGGYVYKMDYVDNFVDRTHGPKNEQLIWYDEYVLTPVLECSRYDDPELFIKLLKESKKKYIRRGYQVYVDGKLEYQSSSRKKAYTFINMVKAATKEAISKYMGVKRIRVIDLAGNSTWFCKDDVEYSMD